MTAWNTILDATLNLNKPWTYLLARMVRDNPIAIAEGASGAPRIAPQAIDFPYFMARRTSSQTFVGGIPLKIPANTEVYDPDSLYDNSTNYRFTPNKPGLYHVSVYFEATESASATGRMIASIRKNGGEIASATSGLVATSEVGSARCETIVQMNGSTDYLEAYADNTTGQTHTLTSARFFAHAICEI